MLIGLIILLGVGCQNVHAQIEGEVGVVSSYVWRGGFDIDPKNIPALQPAVTYTFGDSGFSVNLWASIPISDWSDLKELSEVDITINYDFILSDEVNMSVGFIDYVYFLSKNFKLGDHSSQEVYVTATFPKLQFAPSISFYYDFNLGDGFYIQLSAGHEVKLTDKLNLSLNAALGYNGEQWIDESGISDVNVSASLALPVGKFTITPSVNYTHVFLESLYRIDKGKDKVWIGVVLSM